MEIGSSYAGLTYYDILENCSETVQVQEDGTAEFPVAERSVSVWVAQDTEGQ
jgi:cytoplasmic alpha-amylase